MEELFSTASTGETDGVIEKLFSTATTGYTGGYSHSIGFADWVDGDLPFTSSQTAAPARLVLVNKCLAKE